MRKRVYLDNAATTPLDLRVKKAMEDYWVRNFGNPGGIYEEGRKAKQALSSARETVAGLINASSSEVVFTGSGTESNNLAIFGTVDGFAFGKVKKKPHIITTSFEHKSVLNPIKKLEARGFEVTYLDVGEKGIVDPKALKKALKPNTVLVSIMYVNNEIGTIQPIAEIAKIIRNFSKSKQIQNSRFKTPVFHTDACQASGYLDMDVNRLGVDLLTVNGSKMYGPKGVGMLYVKRGVKLSPIVYGGGQESGLRSGTENIPLIIGFAEALRIAEKEKEKESKRLRKLQKRFIDTVAAKIPNVFLNGDLNKRIPNNINVSVLGVEGESLVLYLDALGIAVSTGSACDAENFQSSHVIRALGKPHEFAHSSIRFSMGKSTTSKDVDYVLKVLPQVVEKLRSVSALS
jgi:cysteine desulfurase